MPLGTAIHNIEITLGRGGQLVRAAGAVAELIAKEGRSATLRLPSGEVRLISRNCSATIGQVGNVNANNRTLSKAGSKRWLGKRPRVRGVVMNPVDHPHGGGEGRTPIGRKKPLPPGAILRLEGRVGKRIEIAMLQSFVGADIRGIQIQIAGRLDGNEIARVEWARGGGRPRHRFVSYGNDGTCDCIRSYRNLNHPLDGMAKETKNELISAGEYKHLNPLGLHLNKRSRTTSNYSLCPSWRKDTDNSGARKLMCIRVLGVSNRQYAHIRDVIMAIVKEAIPNMPLKESEIVRAVVVRTCKELERDNGMVIQSNDNAAVIIDQEGNPKGTRVFVRVPATNITRNIGRILPREGFIEDVREHQEGRLPRINKQNLIDMEGSVTESLPNDVWGQVVSWSSAGACGFKGTKRSTPFAAQTAAESAIRTLMDQGMERAEVMISGPSSGRDTALRAIHRSGILLSFVPDVTPMPHNRCRPPKKRCV
eukprot:Gb_20139 [translate_table: standard]